MEGVILAGQETVLPSSAYGPAHSPQAAKQSAESLGQTFPSQKNKNQASLQAACPLTPYSPALRYPPCSPHVHRKSCGCFRYASRPSHGPLVAGIVGISIPSLLLAMPPRVTTCALARARRGLQQDSCLGCMGCSTLDFWAERLFSPNSSTLDAWDVRLFHARLMLRWYPPTLWFSHLLELCCCLSLFNCVRADV